MRVAELITRVLEQRSRRTVYGNYMSHGAIYRLNMTLHFDY